MSYDIVFAAPEGALDIEKVRAYFAGRPHWSDRGGELVYDNSDTGVGFRFNAGMDSLELRLGLVQPSCFIFEIEPEVTAFAQAFEFVVNDRHDGGMGQGPYVGNGLIAAWMAANTIAYREALQDKAARAGVRKLPRARVQEIWKWNLARSALNAKLGDKMFVSSIQFLDAGGAAKTACSWPGDGAAAMLPMTDVVLIARDKLAPRGLFGASKADVTAIAWRDAAPHFEKAGARIDGNVITLEDEAPPPALAKYIRALPRVAAGPSLAPAKVLEAEMVDMLIGAT